jgi:NDP-sugar pyrophosphorylase family protein
MLFLRTAKVFPLNVLRSHHFCVILQSFSDKTLEMAKQAMIFAAGLGTRLKPLTDTKPKALIPVGGETLLGRTIGRLMTFGYQDFVVNVHHFARDIEAFVAQQDYAKLVRFSDETGMLLETGGGLKKAAPLFDPNEPVLIHNVDILDNVDYNWFANQHQADEDAVLLVSRRQTKRHLLFDNGMRLMGWINRETGEIKSPFPWLREADLTIGDSLQVQSNHNCPLSTLHSPLYAFAFSGIHSFSPRLFPLMDRFPDKFSIIDFYLSVCHRSRIVGLVKDGLKMIDVGKLDSLQAAEEFVKEQ